LRKNIKNRTTQHKQHRIATEENNRSLTFEQSQPISDAILRVRQYATPHIPETQSKPRRSSLSFSVFRVTLQQEYTAAAIVKENGVGITHQKANLQSVTYDISLLDRNLVMS
jgi:hypothetical protein